MMIRPDIPRTDDELNEAASKMPCETCGTPPGRLAVFRAGLRAILAGKCPGCTKARTLTFTLDEQPPPEPPKKELPSIPRAVIAERVIGGLLIPDGQPQTIGQLFDGLRMPLVESMLVPKTGPGTLVHPQDALAMILPRSTVGWLAARYAFNATREAPITTLTALRDRKLTFFAVVCTEEDHIREVLEASHGESRMLDGARGDDYSIYGNNWVYTSRSKVLGWFEHQPDWLRTPPPDDWKPTLVAFATAAKSTTTLDELEAILPAGLVARGRKMIVGAEVEGIEVAFEPAIPAEVLEDALWRGSAARPAAGTWGMSGWILDTHGRGDPGSSELEPPMIGPWVAVPHLEHPPTGGAFTPGIWHATRALDVVTSMTLLPHWEEDDPNEMP